MEIDAINLYSKWLINMPTFNKTILTAYFDLTRNEILETLKHESICIDGKYYNVPEHTLLGCLLNKQYNNIKLDLEQITV